ncbi:hypothetical protein PMIN05_005153 [Paraphaeosphaeria minitans]
MQHCTCQSVASVLPAFSCWCHREALRAITAQTLGRSAARKLPLRLAPMLKQPPSPSETASCVRSSSRSCILSDTPSIVPETGFAHDGFGGVGASDNLIGS